ncbi:hypothetical protein GCM10027431_07200 [Lysobacter rhizosphaerae]
MKVVRIVIVAVLLGMGAWMAIALSHVDADIGAPAGPDRLMGAIDSGAAAGKAAIARDILRQHPIDGRAFRVLAQAEADPARADSFLAIAVRRAPRDRLARAAAIDRAFARGDVENGLLHLDALLRVAPGVREEMLQRLAGLLEHEEIQAALLPRLALAPNWRPALATVLKSPQVPAAPAAALLERLGKRTALQPGEVDAYVTLLNRLGRNAEARRAWWQSLPVSVRGGDANGLFDGGFEQPDVAGGFGWRIATQPGLTTAYDDIDPLEGARSLVLDFDGRAVADLGVEQSLALRPGRYRLAAGVENNTSAARPFLLEVACQGAPAPQLSLELPSATRTPDWQRSQGEFDVPAACSGQILRLRLAARSLQERMVSGTLRLDAIRLNPLGNQGPQPASQPLR